MLEPIKKLSLRHAVVPKTPKEKHFLINIYNLLWANSLWDQMLPLLRIDFVLPVRLSLLTRLAKEDVP